MTSYASMRKEASDRRKALAAELAAARAAVVSCEKEIEVLDQILRALKGAGAGPGRPPRTAAGGSKKAKKKGGKWRPGRPGRPPKWYVEQQKAAGKGSPKAGGRKKPARKGAGRKPARRTRKKAAAPAAPETAAAPAAS